MCSRYDHEAMQPSSAAARNVPLEHSTEFVALWFLPLSRRSNFQNNLSDRLPALQ
jgi:hypothetical protein